MMTPVGALQGIYYLLEDTKYPKGNFGKFELVKINPTELRYINMLEHIYIKTY